jgi:hypothetical protein
MRPLVQLGNRGCKSFPRGSRDKQALLELVRYSSGGYTRKEIEDWFGLHYFTVR